MWIDTYLYSRFEPLDEVAIVTTVARSGPFCQRASLSLLKLSSLWNIYRTILEC